MHQDLDSDRYLIPSEKVFDNAADALEIRGVKPFNEPITAEGSSQN